jgi:hypothetical protein
VSTRAGATRYTSARRGDVVWAGSVLLAGLAPALAALLGRPATADATASAVDGPFAWLFWAVWLVIYPAFGVAARRIWLHRHSPGGGRAVGVAIAAFSSTLAFWLVDSLAEIATIDAIGLVLAYALAFTARRAAPSAVTWLVPLLVWMPITTALKIVLLVQQ